MKNLFSILVCLALFFAATVSFNSTPAQALEEETIDRCDVCIPGPNVDCKKQSEECKAKRKKQNQT